MTLRRQTRLMLRILSPHKVRAVRFYLQFHTFLLVQCGHRLLCSYSLVRPCGSEITIRLDESDALSTSSCHNGESDRFVSTGSTGRRVSFNEYALYEQEKNSLEKGRRYTLTEGDFHHLKKARLTHLHLAPAPCDLKILTIMECDSTESSTINISESAVPKLPLSIYQPIERRVPDWMGQSLSGGLPGDPHHSTVLDQGDRQSLPVLKTQRSQT
ncbi:hypothetical protein ILYODFUR_021556, partial [Ilyodon furcidens]